MRTVPTLCATGAAASLSAVGLVLGRADDDTHANSDMTAIASTYTIPVTQSRRTPAEYTSSKRSFSSPLTRLTGWEGNGTAYSNGGTRQKRSWSPGASTGLSMEKRPMQQDEGPPSQASTPNNARPRSWLRRFSSISTSRDSSRTPTSRPGSAAVSNSNPSLALSRTGSTTLMFPDTTPTPPQPNKLVKRNSSVRSTSGSSLLSNGTRLPLPVFRRPATSHQRSATVQESLRSAPSDDRMSIDPKPEDARDTSWRHYFTPKVAREDSRFGRRPSSSGIPNPIKRVYPDRRYTPVLMSGNEAMRPAHAELDDGPFLDDEGAADTRVAPTTTSSQSTPNNSFSMGDFQWQRPMSSKGKSSTSKLPRRGRPRVTSAPQTSMGGTFSSLPANETGRPAKRRDLTDPQAGHRSIYSSSDIKQPVEPQIHEIQLDLASNTPPTQHLPVSSAFVAETTAPADTRAPLERSRLPSANFDSIAAHHARVSASQSEIAASTVGSESEQRSVDGYSTDYQSDAVFDSFPTRTTRSSSGKRGPPIDTFFDDSPPPTFSSGRSTKLRDFLNDGQSPALQHSGRYRHSTIEEEESVVSTPVRSLHDRSLTSTPSARPGALQAFTSSPPPQMPLQPEPDELDWDMPDDPPRKDAGLGIQHEPSTPARPRDPAVAMPFRFGAFSKSGNGTSVQSTPNRHSNGGADKANLFDWSEQQPSPSHHDQSPPRPRTVHGKKDPADRGSRTTGRRAPSGIHARSNSVPVVPDADGKRSVMANKFGTWGVGSKAVTEDWNEDFDFEEAIPPVPEIGSAFLDEKRIDSGHEMFVPKSIREQQESVVANIGLLREWGLLIEELKELRVRAVGLDMLSGPHAKSWQEVDAMIELADQASDEATLQPHPSPPSSPGFDFDEFDDPAADVVMRDRSHPSSVKDFGLDESEDEAGPLPLTMGASHKSAVPVSATRPRKDSEAVARLVIEALQSKRSVSDPTALSTAPPAKKVPFDTATLRHIVPYVNGLKRKVKDALRETEGLYSSPHRRSPPGDRHAEGRNFDNEPAFVRGMFLERVAESPTSKQQQLRRQEAATDHDEADDPWGMEGANLVSRIERMTLSGSRRA
ncbi:hypothetical protein B0A54_10357 [Friedmanniomyces endolithicus]|uniref:Uncharacterized protein n=1 Tax=Friedmanniomyces endolithicus TaxID=329885 RepID=A0A4V5N7E3_9PEZI|nr:hypothetical protein LTS09_017895 [Friedmanniomyces endolithicus]TKA39339.1 hypothetical protein B0A54_10357 [Friedmanniomyces endolithicus]